MSSNVDAKHIHKITNFRSRIEGNGINIDFETAVSYLQKENFHVAKALVLLSKNMRKEKKKVTWVRKSVYLYTITKCSKTCRGKVQYTVKPQDVGVVQIDGTSAEPSKMS